MPIILTAQFISQVAAPESVKPLNNSAADEFIEMPVRYFYGGKLLVIRAKNSYQPLRSQKLQVADNQFAFLQGGGEMGELTRNFDWAATPLGAPGQWPQSLRTAISIILNSRFPMFLFWGPEHICFYNDAYRPSLGNGGKHPGALGQSGAEVWPEIWPSIKPLIDQVLAGAGATWNEDQLLPIYRNGRMEDVYWTFSNSPVSDESGGIAGVLVTCVETTDKVKSIARIAESKEQLEFAVEASELGTWDLDPTTGRFSANARLKDWFGLQPDDEIPLPLAIAVIADADRQRVSDSIARALQYESGGFYDVNYTIINPVSKQPRVVKARGRAWFGPDEKPYRFNGTLQDVTAELKSHEEIRTSEAKLRTLIQSAPAAIGMFRGRNLIIESPNQTFIEIIGKGPDIEGKSLKDVMPELEQQSFLQILDDVFTTGKIFQAYGAPLQLIRAGQRLEKYFNVTFSPVFNDAGEVYAVIDVSVEVTEQVIALKKQQESESQIRSLVESAPFPIGVYTGREMRIMLANQSILDVWGKGNDVIGKLYTEILPELAGQEIFEQLQEVYASGLPFHARNQRVDIVVDGKLQPYYFNYSFTPLFDGEGKVYGVMNTAAEITDLVLARQRAEEAEVGLRGAIELAQLGTWSIDMATNGLTYSDRMIDWFGFDPADRNYKEVIPILSEEDQSRVTDAVARALDPDSGGVYDETYTVIHARTGQRRVLHAQGKAVFDMDGHPLRMSGTAQDVTIARELQAELEAQVQERTEELAATNEELQATNEELAESNVQLLHSNEELAQYAYVASHDLQEPLRKIRVFSGILGGQQSLTEKDAEVVGKINQSAERMSLLIKDLLEFSRLLNSESLMRPVDLSATLRDVIVDFELVIKERGAVIEAGHLPLIDAVSLQMNQLFYNLISNAIKFTAAGVRPRIIVEAAPITLAEVKQHIHRPLQHATYYDITFTDNGIGFEAQYAEQIFEVFKRLHGRDIYPGSGIGLSLCRRIAGNHNGYLYATSKPGEGTTFHVVLPDRQQRG